MAKELIYRLSNPGYTIYHRAALGGLAATVRAWGANRPKGIEAELHKDHVRLAWGDELEDQEALRRILAASFRLTEDKLIDLPGQAIRADQSDLRLAIHNGLCGAFLQHHRMRPGEKEPRRVEIRSADDEPGVWFTYKALNGFAHQRAQGTGLLAKRLPGEWPQWATIPQSVVPGALGGALELEAPAEEVVLLLFLIVGCAIFLLRPRTYRERAQYCVIVPDVVDLLAYARALQRIAAAGTTIKRFSNSYLGRVVGGAEEAALRFLIDLQVEDIASERSVAGCLAIAMGKVPWDAKQTNRSQIIKLQGDYPELGVFQAANQHLAKTRIIKTKDGEGFAVPASPVPELVAANLAARRHWCAHFKALVSDQREFKSISYAKGGLKAMKEAIRDADDQALIRAFQAAWHRAMRNIYERARRDGLNEKRLLEVERERIRNAILRAKTADALASWFLRFCADATKGNSLSAIRAEAQRLQKFIFNQRNFERFQNLCLFALLSYGSEEAKTKDGGQE